jgi:hypothetical protein
MSSPAVHQSEYIRDVDVESFSRLDSDGSVRKGKWVGSLGGLICRLSQMRVAVVFPQIANSLDPPYITRGFTTETTKELWQQWPDLLVDTQAAAPRWWKITSMTARCHRHNLGQQGFQYRSSLEWGSNSLSRSIISLSDNQPFRSACLKR